jgi:predicted aminopeptidase
MLTDGLIRALMRLLFLASVCVVLPACGTLYLAQAARGQWQVMRERQPIDRVVADARTPEPLRARLAEVRDAREFASRELALPDNGSYRAYADVGRPYVVWNVVAAPELSIEPQ